MTFRELDHHNLKNIYFEMQSSRNVEKMLKLIYADRRSGRPTVYIYIINIYIKLLSGYIPHICIILYIYI